MTFRKLWVGGLILVVIMGAGFIFLKPKPAIMVIHPSIGPVVLAVYATGTVEPSVTIPAAPRQTARLASLFVDEGQSVQKGMVMAQFEDLDLQNLLIERQAALDLAQKEYNRQQGLMKSGAISRQAFDKAVANLESARATVAQTEANLGYLKLVAPEDGYVIRRDGEIGELIPAGQAVLWLSSLKGYRVSAEVDEEDISLVTPGQSVLIRADAFPDDVFKGTVQSITPKGDATSRSYRVRIGLDEKSKLMIGMTAEANIMIREEKEAILIPDTAIKDQNVFVVRQGKVEKVQVVPGARADGKVEIRTGLNTNDLVVMDQKSAPNPGEKIRTRLSANKNIQSEVKAR